MHTAAPNKRVGDLGAARGVDVEVDRIVAHRGPQPGAAGAVRLAQRLDAPAGLVAMTHRRRVLVRADRLVERLEQRQEAGHAVGQRSRRRSAAPRPPSMRRPGAGVAGRRSVRTGHSPTRWFHRASLETVSAPGELSPREATMNSRNSGATGDARSCGCGP